ncbi:serine hydrolase [Microbacterium sp. 18062]|uniref:serine hydrolase n=1 Tax=Microbacterium sp. 18062 TaxID=2681410 RepID=UPI0013587D83|nr:serine hydrolase [Microbacterium sp. 18062]
MSDTNPTPVRRPTIDDIPLLAVPGQPALSPDGRVAYVLRTAELDGDTDRNVHALWMAGDGIEPRRLTSGPADAAPRWAPDGSCLAFLRAADGPAQLWLLPAAGGEPTPLTTVTDLPLGAGAAVWSPDGARIAFSAPVDIAGTRTANEPYVTRRTDYLLDGGDFLGTVRTHVHVVEAATGRVRRVTGGDAHAGMPAWSPDGATLAFPWHVGPGNDLTFRTPVATVDVEDERARVHVVGLAEGSASAVAWIPSGDELVVAGIASGGLASHTRLYRLSLADGSAVELDPGLDRNVMVGGPGYPGAEPTIVGDDVFFAIRDGGCTHLYAAPIAGGSARAVITGAGRVVSGLSISAGMAVVTLATPASYGEIARVDLDEGSPEAGATDLTAHGRGHLTPFPRIARRFTIGDGTVVEGWLLRDPDAEGAAPLLLDVHGGPHNAWNGAADDVHLYHQELVARGWTVLLLNPRGSDGYGEAFYTAVAGGWGVSDRADLLEPIDELVAEGIADPERLAITGYSYGGFATCYLTGRDRRFAAAVAGGAVADLTSLAGTSDSGPLLARWELEHAPWRDAVAVSPQNPWTGIGDVETPTLLLHGAQDQTCPAGQAQQWFTALREREIPTELVLYPGAGHLFVLDGPPSQRIDYNRRVVDWVERFAGTAGLVRRPAIDDEHWQRRLSELAAKHGVPGAQLGILRVGGAGLGNGPRDERAVAVHGFLNAPAKLPASRESVFQIGSISKVWTATLVMQLVDEGVVGLDTPIIEVLPDFVLADMDAARQVTLRHLLVHTSGIDGDVFTDTGRGDDNIEKYVALLRDQTQNHPIGATWSYCNAGFTLAGRVIEVLTGMTWDQALRERLVTPLGLTATVTLPEEALLHPAAVGHVDGPDGPAVAPVWGLPRPLGPAGLITCTADDLLSFARMHLVGGVAEDGMRVLSADAAAEMASLQAELPDVHSLGDSWGVGWIRYGWDGHRLLGHDGNTIGQAGFLRLLPEQGLIVSLLTNGGHARDLYEDLYREIFADLAGVEMQHPLVPPADADADVTPYLGTYERASVRMEVLPPASEGARAVLRTTATGIIADMVEDPIEEYELHPVSEGLFATRAPGTETWMAATFYRLETGEEYVHFGARATPKKAS